MRLATIDLSVAEGGAGAAAQLNLRHVSALAELEEARQGWEKLFLYFHGRWCAPCKAMTPFVSALAEQNPMLLFVVVDVDASRDIPLHYNVKTLPSFYYISSFEVKKVLKGPDPATISAFIEHVI